MADGISECACYISANQIITSESFKVKNMKCVSQNVVDVGKMWDEIWFPAFIFVTSQSFGTGICNT